MADKGETKIDAEVASEADAAEKALPPKVADDAKAATEGAKSGDEAETESDSAAKGNGAAASADTDGDADGATKLEQAIIRQVEYYFGDVNILRDKFLGEQIANDEEGWVPISVLLTFKRLAALSTDPEVITAALAKSDEGLVEISEDKTKLRRHPERPAPEQNDEHRNALMARTAYVKGFPLTMDISDLIKFFDDVEHVKHINMRKYLDKPSKLYKFKGSVFVTFDTVEQAKAFIELPKVEYMDRSLVRKWQEKYLAEKRLEPKAAAAKKVRSKFEEAKSTLPKGAVVLFEDTTADVTREMVREAVEALEGDFEIAYIEFNKGDKEGHIRFQEENIAAKVVESLKDGKLSLNEEVTISVRTLSEEEEEAFLSKAAESMVNRRNQGRKNFSGRKRRGGGGDSGGKRSRRS